MMVQASTETQERMPWDPQPATAQDLSVADVPEDRIYVFYPESPFGTVYIRGAKLKKFNNARLMSDVDGLNEDDLRWLAAQKTKSGQPKYLFTKGDPRKDMMLRANLQQRFAVVAANKAAASNAMKIVDDTNFLLFSALAVAGDKPAYEAYDGGAAATLRTIQALLPSVGTEPEVKEALERFDAQERDAAVIAQAASGRGDDTPTPEEDPAPVDPFAKKE